jgi:glycine/D-amino acid oxidase-like deaminating enzyme
MQTLAATPRNGDLGFWMAGLAEKPAYPRFSGQLSVDLAIVGGGYTGLWAAYFAKKLEPSLSVAVFEAEQVGYGASGRNGGWLSAMIPGNRATFARASGGGMDASRALQQEFITGVDSVLEILEAEGINADQHKGGALVAAHTKAGLGRLGNRRDTDLKYGLTEDEVQFLDRNEFQDRINISTVHGGLFYKHCARLQPAKLVRGLAEKLTAMGVHIYERSRVESADAGTLVLANGRVTADKTFICTEGYSGPLLGHRTLIPINSSMIVTKPLSRGGVAADRLERTAVPERLRPHLHLCPTHRRRPDRHRRARPSLPLCVRHWWPRGNSPVHDQADLRKARHLLPRDSFRRGPCVVGGPGRHP